MQEALSARDPPLKIAYPKEMFDKVVQDFRLKGTVPHSIKHLLINPDGDTFSGATIDAAVKGRVKLARQYRDYSNYNQMHGLVDAMGRGMTLREDKVLTITLYCHKRL